MREFILCALCIFLVCAMIVNEKKNEPKQRVFLVSYQIGDASGLHPIRYDSLTQTCSGAFDQKNARDFALQQDKKAYPDYPPQSMQITFIYEVK